MTAVYVALVEVRPVEGCELLPRDCSGAFVRCYLRALDREAALESVTRELEGEHCLVVATEWCMRRDELTPDMDDEENGNSCAQDAQESGQVIIGRADVWSDEATS